MAGALGSFGGGLIMSRLKLTPAGAVKMMMISCSGFIVGVVIFFFLGCPQINWAGQTDDDRYFCSVAAWRSVSVVRLIIEVTLRRARLV